MICMRFTTHMGFMLLSLFTVHACVRFCGGHFCTSLCLYCYSLGLPLNSVLGMFSSQCCLSVTFVLTVHRRRRWVAQCVLAAARHAFKPVLTVLHFRAKCALQPPAGCCCFAAQLLSRIQPSDWSDRHSEQEAVCPR